MTSLVILHGWGKYTGSWMRIVNALRSKGFSVSYPPLPGLDENQPLSEAWTLDDYVEWVRIYMEQNQIEPPFILGHSFGGRVAIKLAIKYPQVIKGLILVSAAGIRHKKASLFYGLFSRIAKIFKKLSFLPGFQLLREIFYRFFLRKTDYLRLQDQIMRETFKNVIEEDLTPVLDQIKTPTLIIWGEKDKDVPLKNAHLMNQKIKGSQLEILKGIGHKPHQKGAKLLFEKITSFINQN